MRHMRAPSPAMVVACISLVIALSGTTYAAVALPRNSVGTLQLKRNAVTSIKVKDNAIRGADVNEATLGQVPSAANATNAADANLLDGLDSPAFLRSDAAAGGGLAGTFPNPTIAANAVDASNVVNGSLRLTDFVAWSVGGGISGTVVPSQGCMHFNFGTPTGAVQGDLILARGSTALPTGTAFSAVLRTDGGVTGGVCNFTSTAATLSSNFGMTIYGIR